MDVPELKHAPTERHLFEAILNKTVVNILVQVVDETLFLGVSMRVSAEEMSI